MTAALLFVCVVIALIVAGLVAASVRILREYERAVVFRLGRLIGQKGPGLVVLIPGVDRMVRVDLRTIVLDIPPQDLITRDNVPAKVNAVALLPRRRRRLRRRRGRALHRRDIPDRADDAALRARQGRPRHAAGRPRAAQRGAPADHRRADRPLGHQGHDRRDQGRRDPDRRCSARWRARRRPSASGAPR